jgi:hypothetical protein
VESDPTTPLPSDPIQQSDEAKQPEERPLQMAQRSPPEAIEQPPPQPKEPARLRRFFREHRGEFRIVGLVLSIKALLLFYGVLAYHVMSNTHIQGRLGWLGIWNRWDGIHYLQLAERGYQTTGAAKLLIVFYPLYPWTVRGVAFFAGNYLVSAFIVSTIASVVVGVLLYRLARLDFSAMRSRRAVWFMFIFPTSYFLHIGFTESLFLALVLGSFFAARTDRWAIAGLLGACASLSRANGMLLIPALATEAIHVFWRTRRWRWQWLWIVAIAGGFLVYLWINMRLSGDPFGFQSPMREHWRKTFSSPLHGLFEAARNMRRSASDAVMVGFHELAFALLALICTIVCFVKLRPSYGVWMVFNAVLFAGTSFVLSVPRYTLVLFPMYFLFARPPPERWSSLIITAWSLLFLGIFSAMFVRGYWAF